MPASTVIGIDMATQPEKVGLALGTASSGRMLVSAVVKGSRRRRPLDVVRRWLADHGPALVAIDAPLGWPKTMGAALSEHRAGTAVGCAADDLFKRKTDQVVAKTLRDAGHKGFTPLEVGANLIARTAHAALTLLDDLRPPIPLAEVPGVAPDASCAIEVYPAATLASLRLRDKATGYKSDSAVRRAILAELQRDHQVALGASITVDEVIATDHQLDAVLCCLAATHFLEGTVVHPDDQNLAKKEGWIWFHPPK